MTGQSTYGRRLLITALVSLSLVALIAVLMPHRSRDSVCGVVSSATDLLGCAEQAEDLDEYRLVRPEYQSTDIERILSLPYIGGAARATRNSGVVRHVAGEAWRGLSLYNSVVTSDRIYLIDMSGRVVHTWHTDIPYLHVTELLPDGSLLAVFEDTAFVKMDANSRVQWRIDTRAHHSVQQLSNGDILFLDRESSLRPEIHPSSDTLEDFIVLVSPDGTERLRFSLLDCVLNSSFAYLLPLVNDLDLSTAENPNPEIDILHANHAEVIEISENLPRSFVPGHILVSLRNLNTIGIIDPEEKTMVWAWGPPNLVSQHHSTVLENGNIMIFNNGSHRSEIIEFDSESRASRWRYRENGFLSRTRGSSQRLPNGNTLITESDDGRVIEVTEQGEIVWEFLNPQQTEKGLRQAIYRMTRYSAEELNFGSIHSNE
ncbi:MAG: arylsulfotransferase family protein [Acidobacteriota bacterium]|nr:arylsulfotransferase family protein [Acidobacteriota bacterium]